MSPPLNDPGLPLLRNMTPVYECECGERWTLDEGWYKCPKCGSTNWRHVAYRAKEAKQ